MKVIFLEDLRKIKTGDVVEVKFGYAKNYLFPRKKVIIADRINLEYFEKIKKNKEEASSNNKSEALKLKTLADEKYFNIILEASKEGALYASVGKKDVLKELNKIIENNSIKLKLELQNINISYKVKTLGLHKFQINLSVDVNFYIYLNIGKSQSDLESNLKELNK